VKQGKLKFVMETLDNYRQYFENYLLETSENRKNGVPEKLFEAMEYSLAGGGKRLRPVLCLAAAERCGCFREDALPMALGIEMFHSASLIHDDLPCMDDDDMRRGKPSNHNMFGETMAILAGDSLLTGAFEYPLVNTKNISSSKLLNAMKIFARATGAGGVCGGQALDMDDELKVDAGYAERVALLKTATLISASVICGAALGTDDKEVLKGSADYGTYLGLAFQIVDDILDVTGTKEETGKSVGKDVKQGKITHATAYGLEEARQLAVGASSLAQNALPGTLKCDEFFMLLPEYLLHRMS